MQKQTIYSYLQRSLVKILSKSNYSNKYKTPLVKPLKESCSRIAGYAKPIKNSIKIVTRTTQVALQSKTLNFFRKVNTSFMPFLHVLRYYEHQSSLRLTCKFYLISFLRPRFGVLISKCYGRMLLKKTKAKQKKREATKQKLIKLNQNLNNDLISLLSYFRAKRLDSNFYPPTLCCNKKTLVCSFYPTCFYCPTCRAHSCIALRSTKGYATMGPASKTRRAQKTKAFLFANPFKQKLCKASTNFDFYDKPSQLLFCQSFYKRKDKSKDYRNIYQNLFYFFSFFSFTTNKEVCFFNSAELAAAKQVSFTRYAQQVLYLHKIEKQSIACCFQLLCFSSNNLNSLNTLQFLRNKISIIGGCLEVSFRPKRQEMQGFSFPLFCFLTIIFYVSIKYIKEFQKQVDDSFQPELLKNKKYKTYKFNKIIDFNFLSFKPSFRKLAVSCHAFNSHDFFLMRPLFSLTRLDTFFICESLKLPIYPDKSNLRVDFLRNRVRKQILPAIRILLNPQFDTILSKFYE